MNIGKRTALTALVLAIAVPAGAQMFARPQFPKGIFNPVVGAGAEYESKDASGTARTVEFAVVGKENVDGKAGYWIEFSMPGTPMGDVVVKTLVVLSEGNVNTSKIILQMPGRPPMEMPPQMEAGNRGVNLADIRSKAVDVGTESVTTPAGTFQCHHYRAKDGTGDSWLSESVRPFGLVKSKEKGSTTVLVKTLTGVKDKITGTPQPFNPMLLMQRPKP